jgi:hypothetical protein
MEIPLLLGIAGWVLAGVAFGLWWGERGRRLDTQWKAGSIRPPTATAGAATTIHPEEKPGAGIVSDEVRENIIADTMTEGGVSRRVAEKEVDDMLAAFALHGPIAPE